MSLSYGNQSTIDVIGTAAADYTLTTAYDVAAGTKQFNSGGLSEIALYVAYTPGAGGGGNSIQIRVRTSPDGIDDSSPILYQDITASAGTGTITVSQAFYTFVGAVAATLYKLRILVPVADKIIEVSVKETVVGGAAGTTRVRALLSGKV